MKRLRGQAEGLNAFVPYASGLAVMRYLRSTYVAVMNLTLAFSGIANLLLASNWFHQVKTIH